MTSIHDLVDRLDRVHPRGPGSWIACCPAHEDRTPSLSIRETQDGTILIKCFGGCSAAEVVAAVGLELQDLFPDEPPEYGRPHQPRRKPRIGARDLIRTLRHVLLVVALGAEQLSRSEPLSEPDCHTLDTACRHIHQLLKETEDVT